MMASMFVPIQKDKAIMIAVPIIPDNVREYKMAFGKATAALDASSLICTAGWKTLISSG
jgi:hypothetical protein